MSRTSSSRARKQNFSPNNNSSFFSCGEDIDTEDGSQDYIEDDCPPRRANRTTSMARKISDPRDRQSQLDHNEQERGRRRELAIIYEMIRTCITEDDIRRHLDGTAKSADKLSYPQLLQISCGKIQDELHDQRVIRTLFRDIEILENLCDELGISLEKKRPAVDQMERHKIIAEVVEDVLSVDKRTQRRNRRPIWSRRTNPTVPLASPVHSPFPLSPPAPLSPNEDSRLTPEIIDQVISQFPLQSLSHEPHTPFSASLDVHDLSDRATNEGGDIRFDDSISNEEATSLLREFDVNGIDDLGFEALFGLVNCGSVPEDLDSVTFSYFS
nr:expressed protein [Hymenolepis microstoma]